MKKITKPAAKSSPSAAKEAKEAKSASPKPAPAPVRQAKPAAKAPVLKVAKAAPAPAVLSELVPARPKPTKAPKVVKAPAAEPTVEPKAGGKSAPITIVAVVDVGFGNALTLRGEGAGLSWDTGLPLACAAANRWTISLPDSAAPVTFKFLVNDSVWSVGENFTLVAGASAVFSPAF